MNLPLWFNTAAIGVGFGVGWILLTEGVNAQPGPLAAIALIGIGFRWVACLAAARAF